MDWEALFSGRGYSATLSEIEGLLMAVMDGDFALWFGRWKIVGLDEEQSEESHVWNAGLLSRTTSAVTDPEQQRMN